MSDPERLRLRGSSGDHSRGTYRAATSRRVLRNHVLCGATDVVEFSQCKIFILSAI